MIIGYTGIDLPQGKVKYNDENLLSLVEKDKPKKVSPYFFEFVLEDYIHSFAIAVKKENILDFLIYDMEIVEKRIERISEPIEIKLMEKCMEYLEQETPLCDVDFNDSEKDIIAKLSLASIKPVIQLNNDEDVNKIMILAIEKANYMFFYTSGAKESRSWFVPKGSDIITCASKIHTDLARGFIRGDVVKFPDYLECYNFNECKTKGVASVVDKDYIVNPNEIIEIRFNV